MAKGIRVRDIKVLGKVSGVYAVYSPDEEKYYIGSGIDIGNRWSWHLAKLRHRKGYHDTPTSVHILQAPYDTYGEDRLQLRILERCDRAALREAETRWIQKIPRRYNKGLTATGHGRKASEETKLRMSELAKERNAKPEYKAMLVARAKQQHRDKSLGTHVWTEDGRRRVSEASKKNSSRVSKAMWADPEVRSRLMVARKAQWTPERRAAQAERVRQQSIARRKLNARDQGS